MHEKWLKWCLLAFTVHISKEIVNNHYVIKHKYIRIQPTKMNNNVSWCRYEQYLSHIILLSFSICILNSIKVSEKRIIKQLLHSIFAKKLSSDICRCRRLEALIVNPLCSRVSIAQQHYNLKQSSLSKSNDLLFNARIVLQCF